MNFLYKTLKIWIMFILSTIMILSNINVVKATNNSSYNLQDRINIYETNTTNRTGILETVQIDGSDTIWKENSRFYCITRGQGANDPEQKTEYSIQYFFKISANGVAFEHWVPGPYSLTEYTWDEIEDFYGEDGIEIIKQMYYILNASDSYGTCYKGNMPVKSYDGTKWEDDQVSQRQYAIWMTIDKFLGTFGVDNNNNDYNTKNCESYSCELYNQALNWASNTSNNVGDSVYMWGFEAYLKGDFSYTDKTFWQNLILAGKKTTPPPVIPQTGSLTITKKDANTGDKLSGARFKLYKNNISQELYAYNGQTEFTTGSNGSVTINGLEKGATYWIYETQAPSGYDLSFQKGYNGSTVFLGKATIGTDLSVEYTNEKSYGSLNVKKKGTYAGSSGSEYLDNVKIGIATSPGGKIEKSMTKTIKNANNGVTFENLIPGTYYIYEISNGNSGYTPLSFQNNYNKHSNGYVYLGNKEVTANRTSSASFIGTNVKYGKITVTKKDSGGATLKSGVGIAICNARKGSVIQEDYITNGEITFKKLSKGTYYIYETENNNVGYDLSLQGIAYENIARQGDTFEAAYLGYVDIDTTKDDTIEFEKKFDATNTKYGSITINKKGEEGDSFIALKGATFELYNENDKRSSNGYGNTTFTTGEDGTVTIDKIPYGKYTIYEVKVPDGYDPKIQKGYVSAEGQHEGHVKIATVTIADTAECTLVEDKENGVEYRTKVLEKATSESGPKITLNITNRKYINISGYVWEDVPNTKVNTYNSIYDGEFQGINNTDYGIDATSQQEKKITNGVTINLKSMTDSKFSKKASITNNEYKITKVDASKLYDYYVEFDYSKYNEDMSASDKKQNQYITVAPEFEQKNGSKALVNGSDIRKEDNDLVERANTGSYLSESLSKLRFYNSNTQTLENVNLGIKILPKTEIDVSQNIAYVLITMNGYQYKYVYGDGGKVSPTKFDSIMSVNWQSKTDIEAYTRAVYPSDIVYNKELSTEELKIQVVYRIDITNNVSYNIEDLYVENCMDLISLTDTYDAGQSNNDDDDEGRYALADSKWHKNGNGGSANINNSDISFGIGKKSKETATTYITFNIKNAAILKILESPNGLVEDFPTEAIATAIHQYKRKDYYWNDKLEKEEMTKEHSTNRDDDSDKAPYLNTILAENRTISGIVFEDDSLTDAEILGNGIYNVEKENVITDVKVELIDATTREIANLERTSYNKDENGNYMDINKALVDGWTEITAMFNVKDESTGEVTKKEKGTGVFTKSAEVTTSLGGTYSFVGVVPGEYYVRFTYGDGTQKLYDTEGNEISNSEISSEDYKSTIISSEIKDKVKTAYDEENNGIEDTKYLWYLDLKDNNYNLAVDENIDQSSEKIISYATMEPMAENVSAITPKVSVPIEFTTNTIPSDTNSGVYIPGAYVNASEDSHPTFNSMSFGIIKKPEIRIDLKKEITNVKLTLQNGQILINGNPKSQNLPYTVALDNADWSSTGSQYIKVELNNQYIYRAELEVEYKLTVTNNSDVTYLGEDYYKYGEQKNETAKVNVKELIEYLSPKFKMESSNRKVKEMTVKDNKTVEVSDNSEYNVALNTLKNTSKDEYKTIYSIDDTKTYDDTDVGDEEKLDTTELNSDSLHTSTSVNITAKKILSTEDDDLDFTSYAQVLRLSVLNDTYRDPTALPIAKAGNTIEGGDPDNPGNPGNQDNGNQDDGNPFEEIPTDSSEITITPSTGDNKDMTNYVSVAIVLIALGSVIICIKKIRE